MDKKKVDGKNCPSHADNLVFIETCLSNPGFPGTGPARARARMSGFACVELVEVKT